MPFFYDNPKVEALQKHCSKKAMLETIISFNQTVFYTFGGDEP